MGIQDGIERTVREGQDWASDTLALKDLMPLLPEFHVLTEVDKFCDEKTPEFEAIGEMEVMTDPRKVLVMVLEASSFLHRAQDSLRTIHSSGLRFSERYCEPYKVKLENALKKFEDVRYRLFQKAVALLQGWLLSGPIRRIYDLDDRDVEALVKLEANLKQFHLDLQGFGVDFNSIIAPSQHDPCNNKILSEFMYESKHVDFFRGAYETLVEAKSIEEMDWKERLALAQKLKKDWDAREKREEKLEVEEEERLIASIDPKLRDG